MNHPAPETGFHSAQTEHAGVTEHALDAHLQPSKARRLASIASVLAALALVVLNTAITNTALQTISQSLQVSPALSIWIITANQAALLIALLPCAALGESLGYRKVFRWGVGTFLAGTLMCVLAPTLNWLIAARLLQGLGGAAVMALAVALLRQVVPSHQLGAVIGWNALVVALASAAGPVLGAVILGVADWPWLFAVLLPFGLLVMLASGAIPVVDGTNRKADLLSMALNAGALGALVIAAGIITERPALTAALLTISAIQLVLLVKRERQKEAPLIPLDLLRSNSFSISVIASVLSFAGQTAGLVALPFYLHHNLGQGILETGLFMLPWPITVALFARVAGHLSGRWSTAWLCSVGGVCLATGLTGAALWPLQANLLMLVPLTMLCGLGFSLFNVANNRNMFLASPINRSGAAGGMQGTARLLGQTAGAVIMTLLFKLLPAESAPQFALCVGASLNLLAAFVSTQQRMPKAIN